MTSHLLTTQHTPVAKPDYSQLTELAGEGLTLVTTLVLTWVVQQLRSRPKTPLTQPLPYQVKAIAKQSQEVDNQLLILLGALSAERVDLAVFHNGSATSKGINYDRFTWVATVVQDAIATAYETKVSEFIRSEPAISKPLGIWTKEANRYYWFLTNGSYCTGMIRVVPSETTDVTRLNYAITSATTRLQNIANSCQPIQEIIKNG